jgi:hypothetical protein
VIGIALLCLKGQGSGRKILLRLQITLQLVVEAALEFSTLTSQFLGIKGNFLVTGSTGGNRHKMRHPGGATQLPAAGPDSTNPAGLLPGTNLLHFYTDLELIGVQLDEFPEINP